MNLFKLKLHKQICIIIIIGLLLLIIIITQIDNSDHKCVVNRKKKQ